MNAALSPKVVISVLVLSVLGYLGNYLVLPIAFGVSFIFGSIVSMIAIVTLGLRWGVLVALIAASCTFFLWNHPYAIIIFTMEALWVGLALRRGQNNLVVIDALFWLSLGSISVVAFYGGFLGLDSQTVLMIVLKQSINGVLNTLIASLILYIPFIRQQRLHNSIYYSYKNLIFNTIAVFLIVPTLALLLFNNYRENIALNQQVAKSVHNETLQVENEISHWLSNYLKAIESINQLTGDSKLVPSQTLQQQLSRTKNLFPDFENVYLADETATTIGFYPDTNKKGESLIGLNFSDRPYFKSLRANGKPVISDVFIGRGGTTDPIVTISAAKMRNNTLSQFALGAVNIKRLQQNLILHGDDNGLILTLVDSSGHIIISNDVNKKPLEKFVSFTGSQLATDLKNVFLHVPGKATNVSMLQAWKNSSYFSNAKIAHSNWTLYVEYPLAPMQAQLYMSAIHGLLAVVFLFLPMLIIAYAVSNALIRPLQTLAKISADLPKQIEGNEQINWPTSKISEVLKLIRNFKAASNALSNKIGSLNNRLSLATDSAGIGVWDYYVQENKLIWDKWMYALYGITEDQFEGAYEAWKNGLHPDDVERCDHAIKLALNNEKDFDIEFRVLWPSGEVRYIKANAHVQRDKNGQAMRMIGINYDITDRKLATDKLEQAVSKAQVANEAKSEFLANMSHEIRTPMNGVIGMINQLLRTQLNPQQYSFANTVKKSAESLLNIINDILDFSKVEAGKLQLDYVDFELQQLMYEFCEVIKFRTEEKGLLLSCPIKLDSPLWLHGDAGRIRQILVNLVGNAIKFTEQGEIKVSYSIQSQTQQTVLLRFEIQDNGIGLSEEQQKTLFNRFSQADGSTTRRYGGTGLGLAICKQLVALMGGEIGVSSSLDNGALFWFTLKLSNAQATHENLPPVLENTNFEKDAVLSQALPQFTGRVLVVEDNPINQMVAQCQLEDFGIEVELADNGELALQKLVTTQYDLVFMDCQMPVMDGFHASRLIRDEQTKVLNSSIPIIAMTANVIKGDREKCLAAGMNDYISKPVDPQKLAQALQKWLPKV